MLMIPFGVGSYFTTSSFDPPLAAGTEIERSGQASLTRGDDEDRALRAVGNGVRHTSEHPPSTRHPPVADNDQIGIDVLRDRKDGGGCLLADAVRLHLEASAQPVCQRAQPLARGRFDVGVGRRRQSKSDIAYSCHLQRRAERVNEVQCRAVRPGQLRSRLDRLTRARPSVRADNDRVKHHRLLIADCLKSKRWPDPAPNEPATGNGIYALAEVESMAAGGTPSLAGAS